MLFRLLALLATLAAAACAQQEDALPKLGIEIGETSVSGLSAGAYMAGQLQLAHSRKIVGVGLVAGGPFGCAESSGGKLFPYWPAALAQNLAQALNGCMADNWRYLGIPNAAALAARARELAREGKIDPLEALAEDKVYLFSGAADRVVARSVVEAAARFYAEAGVPQAKIALVTHATAGHAFLTEDWGAACGISKRPYLSDCDYDQAAAILSWIYGELQPAAEEPAGRFILFDQRDFAGGSRHGLARQGVLYVPEACAESAGCRLHIALHACEQAREQIGMDFVERSGFARWADNNRLVVLFPQAAEEAFNPRACWDWWGYTGTDFLTKGAPQVAAIWAIVERLAER